MDPLTLFHPVVSRWFRETFRSASPPQRLGWPPISRGESTLLLAPTGSGKTLAAFLWAINHLFERHLAGDSLTGVGILYISPLKALNNDIHRNLQRPLTGIQTGAERSGLTVQPVRTAVRTGDTPQSERARMLKDPPEILITTPESLYLMLTAPRARPMFRSVQYVIIDEIHSVCGNKRGVHLSLSLERLAALADQEFVRIGLSATQKPLREIARFLGGQTRTRKGYEARSVTIVDAGQKKTMDLRVVSPVPDFSELPQESVWPALFEKLLDLIRSHRTTLIFVNNRRLAERVAARLNELISGAEQGFNLYAVPKSLGKDADAVRVPKQPIVKAYHGSMSREAREVMEQELKDGELRALVATSSLELGIDIGSIDLVVQLQSPKGIARGLQRIGRSGHLVTATSKGRIFPTYREDLVESAVAARAMTAHDVETTGIPGNCLDVLAQQIVAMVSVEEWDVDELFGLVRGSFCYRDLSREAFSNVLRMLSGRYANESLRELKARISWDKQNNLLRSLPGSRTLAIGSGGTITDRGYFGVYLEDGKTKVGEVDEEFVFESRAGDTFLLGTSVWKMLHLDANRITVRPAPGEPARMPFWRGEGIGRSFELGRAVGEFRRELAKRLDDPSALGWIQSEFPVDSDAAWNILEYFRRQERVAGMIPHDRLIVVEGFRDEIGDPRIVVHSCFGRGVNGLLGQVVVRILHERIGSEPQMLYNDNGILLRCADTDDPPLDILSNIDPAQAIEAVLEGILTSPLYGGQFRQNAARALLMPRPRPGKRLPLWLQRLRAADLLDITRRYDDFPIVIETMREVLNDILDLNHFRSLLQDMASGSVRAECVQTEVPSPFAASLLFDFIAVYLYEWDQPRSDQLGQYLSVNRELLSELVDLDSIGTMLRPEAIEAVNARLQHTADGYQARSPEELFEIIRRVGDLTESEITERCRGNAREFIDELSGDGRAIRMVLGGSERWVAAEDGPLYSSMHSDDGLSELVARFVVSHGTATPGQLSDRYGVPINRVVTSLHRLSTARRVLPTGRGTESDETTEWSEKRNLERIHRQTIAILRKEIEPAPLPVFASFLARWQKAEKGGTANEASALEQTLLQMQGIPLPVEVWEREIFRKRIPAYRRDLLSQLVTSGTFLWIGSGSGRMTVVQRGNAGVFFPADAHAPGGESARRILSALQESGASFLSDIRSQTGLSLHALNRGMAELFWSGVVTNDQFEEIINVRQYRQTGDEETGPVEPVFSGSRKTRGTLLRRARKDLTQIPGWSGRWSMVRTPAVLGPSMSDYERAEVITLQIIRRYGIVAKEICNRESALPWSVIFGHLQRLELRGELRRGYFVSGLSGMQFAHPSAVDEIRSIVSRHHASATLLCLNACDPALPYGPGVPFPAGSMPVGSVGRHPGNFVISRNGAPVMMIENYGSRIWSDEAPEAEIIEKGIAEMKELLESVGASRALRRIRIEYWNGKRPTGSGIEPILRNMGFRREANQTMEYDRY